MVFCCDMYDDDDVICTDGGGCWLVVGVQNCFLLRSPHCECGERYNFYYVGFAFSAVKQETRIM